MAKEVLEVIRQRRSVRSFLPQPVAPELIMTLLEAAVWAPSAGNLQPWQFYVVRAPEAKAKLARAAGQAFVARAPVVIVACALPEQSAAVYGSRGRLLYCLQDVAAAVQNMLLAASSLGLAACWVGAFREEAVVQALNLPPEVRPVVLLPLGYGGETAVAPPRHPLSRVVQWVD